MNKTPDPVLPAPYITQKLLNLVSHKKGTLCNFVSNVETKTKALAKDFKKSALCQYGFIIMIQFFGQKNKDHCNELYQIKVLEFTTL